VWASPKTVLDTLEAGPVGAVQIFCKHFDRGTGVAGGGGVVGGMGLVTILQLSYQSCFNPGTKNPAYR
jgi:hypothetical protein